jgi:hypothetical protein
MLMPTPVVPPEPAEGDAQAIDPPPAVEGDAEAATLMYDQTQEGRAASPPPTIAIHSNADSVKDKDISLDVREKSPSVTFAEEVDQGRGSKTLEEECAELRRRGEESTQLKGGRRVSKTSTYTEECQESIPISQRNTLCIEDFRGCVPDWFLDALHVMDHYDPGKRRGVLDGEHVLHIVEAVAKVQSAMEENHDFIH